MLKINMISTGEDIQGQGVGSAYYELVHLIETHGAEELSLSFNKDKGCDLNHVHTIHPKCLSRMRFSLLPSCMHVHFLPETLQGSIELPAMFQGIFYKYVLHVYRSAKELIVVNPIFIDPLVDYGLDRDRITYIPNVVASNAFYPMKEKDPSLYETFSINPNRFTVLGVGQVQTRKGIWDFAEIARHCPDMDFVWAGGFSFGSMTDGYEELNELMKNPPANVRFLGIVDRKNMNTLYNLCDVFFMPSYNELMPMAVLEAANAGCPIVLRDLELYEKIYFTDYLKADDNHEFARLLYALRDHEPTREQAKRASKKIVHDYSEQTLIRQWIDYYHRIYDRWHV